MTSLLGKFGEGASWMTVTIGTETSGLVYYPSNGQGGTTNVAAVAVATATWTESSLTITKIGGFAAYTFVAGDTINVTGGTGATAGVYTIASKTSNDAIVLTSSIGAGADGQTDIAATIRIVDQSPQRGHLAGSSAATALRVLALNGVVNDVVVLLDSSGTALPGGTITIKSTACQIYDFGPGGVNLFGQQLGMKVTGTGTYALLYKRLE